MTSCSHDNILAVRVPMQLHRPASGRRCIRYSTRLRYLLFSKERTPDQKPISDGALHPSCRDPTLFRGNPYPQPRTLRPSLYLSRTQTRGHDEGATGRFVRRFARMAPPPYRGLRAARRNEAGDGPGGLSCPLTPTLLSTGGCRSEGKRAVRRPRNASVPTNLPSLRKALDGARSSRSRASVVRDRF